MSKEIEISGLEFSQPTHRFNIKKTLATSLSIFVIKRILDIIHQQGRINKTNLAGKTGLNYAVCSRYVNTLTLFGWLRIRTGRIVTITESGIVMSDALEILNEK